MPEYRRPLWYYNMQRQAQHGIDMYVQKNIETATTTTKAQKRTKVVPPVNLKIMTDYGAERDDIFFSIWFGRCSSI